MDRAISVLTDTHGHYESVVPVVEAEIAHGNHLIFAGDFVDGPNTAGVIRLIRSLGDQASAITGNHEWVLRNALADAEQQRSIWHEHIWPSYERMVPESYGLNRRGGSRRSTARQLADVLHRNGDLDWLNSLPAYVETDDTVVVHAGPNPGEPWWTQSQALDVFSEYPRRMQREPDQVFSRPNSLMTTVGEEVDDRTFVTGHAHLAIPIEERIGERRVRLATSMAQGAGLLVWRSDERRILPYPHRG